MSSEEKKEERERKTEGKKTKKIPWKINSKGKVGSSKDYLFKTFKSQCELMT